MEILRNTEIETTVMGACLRVPENVPTVLDVLGPDDFLSHNSKAILIAIKSLYERKAPIDLLSVATELKNQGKEILHSNLIEIEDKYFDGMNLDHYLIQLKTYTKRRKLQTILYQALKEVEDPSIEYPELEGKITRGVMDILDRGHDRRLMTSENLLKEVISTYYQRKVEREQGRIHFGVPTGFTSIDNTLGGLQDGTLGVLAGRQHHGKSTVAMDILLNALKAEILSLYISLEQPSAEILLYLLQKLTGIKPLNIKSGNLTLQEEKLLTTGIYAQFKTFPIFFEDQSRTLQEVSMRIRRMVLSHKVKFVVIDYLQLIENPLKRDPRHIEVAGISRTLKRLAMELNIPILVLSQLNKSPEERESKRIFLSDMRESEAISQDADYVIFIHRPILMGKDDKDHLELAKNRHGETISRVNVTWDRMKNTYKEMRDNGR